MDPGCFFGLLGTDKEERTLPYIEPDIRFALRYLAGRTGCALVFAKVLQPRSLPRDVRPIRPDDLDSICSARSCLAFLLAVFATLRIPTVPPVSRRSTPICEIPNFQDEVFTCPDALASPSTFRLIKISLLTGPRLLRPFPWLRYAPPRPHVGIELSTTPRSDLFSPCPTALLADHQPPDVVRNADPRPGHLRRRRFRTTPTLPSHPPLKPQENLPTHHSPLAHPRQPRSLDHAKLPDSPTNNPTFPLAHSTLGSR